MCGVPRYTVSQNLFVVALVGLDEDGAIRFIFRSAGLVKKACEAVSLVTHLLPHTRNLEPQIPKPEA